MQESSLPMDIAELKQAAGSYVAGDLTDGEREAFEALLQDDPTLQSEVDYWDRMLPSMPAALHEVGIRGPGPGLIAAVKVRAVGQSSAGSPATVVRPGAWAWSGWVVAAAAALALLVVLNRAPTPATDVDRVLAYNEDGTAHALLADWQEHPEWYPEGGFMPRARGAASVADHTVERPWLGVSTIPMRLKDGRGDERSGLQVVRVIGDSPAARAGLLPGDVLLTLGGCQMMTSYCIMRAIHEGDRHPGDRIEATFYRPSIDEVLPTTVRLARVVE